MGNVFMGAKCMNIAQGDGAIGSQVNTIVHQGNGRTVVSQQVKGRDNIYSGICSVSDGESITVVDDDIFIKKNTGKSKEYMAALDKLVSSVRSVFGDKSNDFVEALKQALDNQESKARLAVLEEETAILNLHLYPDIMRCLSELIMHSKDGVSVNPKIRKAHDALVDFLSAEAKEATPDTELMERVRYAIKMLTDKL